MTEANKIVEAPESSDGNTFYDANVKILKVFKGESINEFLNLKFKPFTTGIEKGAKHIFFLKKRGKGFEVLKSSFIYPRGQGFDNHMVLFGSIVCSEDVGLDVIKYLATLDVPLNIEARLVNEYSNSDAYSAIHIASATAPVFGNSVLKKAVSEKERKRFDIDLYGTAAYALAIQQNQDNWREILDNIPHFKGYGRVAESIAFDLAANSGDEKVISIIKDVVSRKPELAVSAAFALSKIGGKEAQSVIENWLKDKKLSEREELISKGWTQRKITFSELFKEALEKMTKSENQ
ncbi:MAG: hypothetical protein ABI891_00555 [Acidobacteriota bacterium]